MAETQREDYYRYQQQRPNPITSRTSGKANPSTSQVIAIATLVPVGASLLILAGLTLTLTVIGLSIATPLFVFFSPVFIPATLIIGLAIAGVLTSGAFGVTALSSFAWLASYLRRTRLLDRFKQHAKPRLEEDYDEAQGAKDTRDRVESRAQEMGREAQSELGKAQKVNRTSS